jgi:predicted MFS family arabinose efflux permease
MVMPLWVGAVLDHYGLSTSAVGTITALEMGTVALVSLAMAVRVQRFRPLASVVVGLACLTIGNLLSAFVTDAAGLTACRMLVGVGKGIVVTISFSLAAGTRHPTRTFAVLNACYALFSMLFFLTVPPVIAAAGARGVFLLLSAVVLVSALGLVTYPRRRLEATELAAPSLTSVERFGLIAFGALIMLWIGHNAIWTFVERLGLRVGLSPVEIGQVLSLAAFIAIGGPTLARLIDTRFGQTAPIFVAIIIKALAILALVYLSLEWLFSVLVPVFLFMALFTLPYFMGLLSQADPAGRLTAAASAAMTIGSALGALFGGWTTDAAGYVGLGWLAEVFLVLALGLMGAAAVRLRRVMAVAAVPAHGSAVGPEARADERSVAAPP